MNRRNLILALPPFVLLLRCMAPTDATPAQIIADAQGVVSATKVIVLGITAVDPNAIPAEVLTKINALEVAATAALDSLTTASTPVAGASLLHTVDTYLNFALMAVGYALPAAALAFPVLSPYIVMYDAAVALVINLLEPYVESRIPPTKPTPKMHAVKDTMDVNQARDVLNIKH